MRFAAGLVLSFRLCLHSLEPTWSDVADAHKSLSHTKLGATIAAAAAGLTWLLPLELGFVFESCNQGNPEFHSVTKETGRVILFAEKSDKPTHVLLI